MPDLGNIPTPHQEIVECVAYYGLRIQTEHGTCTLDYRNDSNGYYGGYIVVKQEETKDEEADHGA